MAHDSQVYIDGWVTYSDWIDEIRDSSDTLESYDHNEEFKSKLATCKNNRERFELVWSDHKIRKEIKQIYQEECRRHHWNYKHSKSSEESKKARDFGNKCFKEGNFNEAIIHYTNAIKYAPYPNDKNKNESLALALANRSAALYSLTRYKYCLKDINLAIRFGYPEENLFKLFIRKVKCLHILSVWDNDLEEIKQELNKMLASRATKEFIKTEIKNMFEFIEQTQPEDMDKDESDITEEAIIKMPNSSKTLPRASDCVEMSYDPEKGRYLLINRDIFFCRLLISEEPYSCLLAPSKWSKYCHHCFENLFSCGISCRNCSQILYCSESCMDANYEVHRHECNGMLNMQPQVGVSYLAARIIFKIDFKTGPFPVYSRRSSVDKSIEELLTMKQSDWPDFVFRNTYSAVFSLDDHFNDYEYDQLMSFLLTACIFMEAFIQQFSTSKPQFNEKEFQITCGSMVTRHLLQFQTNLISILDQNLRKAVPLIGHKLGGVDEFPIGIGLYPTMSLMNHSCSPNVITIFHRNKFIARAGKSLTCGSEIEYCYGPCVNRMSKVDRQARLKDQYFFDCKCEWCANDREDETRAFICPKCGGPVIYNRDSSNSCMKCKKGDLIDTRECLNRVESYKSEMRKVTDSSMPAELKIKRLEEIENELKKLVFWRHPSLADIKSCLITCSENIDNVDLVLKYCKQELDLVSDALGKDSYEALITRLKYINYQWKKLHKTLDESPDVQSETEAIEEMRTLAKFIGETRYKLREMLSSTNIMGAESSYQIEFKFLNETFGAIQRFQREKGILPN